MKLKSLGLDRSRQALSILWFHDEASPDVVMPAGQLSKIILETGLGNPNSTQLAKSIRKSGKVITSAKGFRLKTLSRSEIREWLQPILGRPQPPVDQDLGYLPKAVWANTRGYIEKIATQLNGCFQFGFYDAAAVMIRRLIETLIIECYEHLGRDSEIRGADGNFLMLRDLVVRAKGKTGLAALTRNGKKALDDVKALGDLSAHNRYYNAVQADLEKVQMGVRAAVDEMLNLAGLRT